MNERLGAVLWDLDGVLVDSSDLHYLSWSKVLADFDIPLSREKFLKFFGRAPTEVTEGVIGVGVSPSVRAEIRRRKDKLFQELAPSMVRPMPGALEWVKYFSGHIPQAVASSASLEQARLMLESAGLGRYFRVVITSSETPGKPDPAVFLTAARRLGVEPANCLVFEDSPSGIEAARQAGMRVIAVCTTNPTDALSGADLILPNLTPLTVAHIQKLFSVVFDEESLLL